MRCYQRRRATRKTGHHRARGESAVQICQNQLGPLGLRNTQVPFVRFFNTQTGTIR